MARAFRHADRRVFCAFAIPAPVLEDVVEFVIAAPPR